MQHIQRLDQKLVCILLLVPCQMPGVCPHQVQQLVRHVGRAFARIKLLEQTGHLTDQTLALVWKLTHVSVREKVVAQKGRVSQSLYDTVHETRVPQIDQTAKSDKRMFRNAEQLSRP